MAGFGAFTGESEGLASQAGELRCAAEACVKALSAGGAGRHGVRAARRQGGAGVRCHRRHRVSRSYRARDSGHRVVGSYLTENDAARGAALAVLNATNRILGNRLFMR